MFLQGEHSLPYAIILSSSAPYSLQLALSSISWPIIFILIALPSLSLLLSIGQLSGVGPVLTFQRIAPIASGVGWALVWLASEKLFVEGLRGSQNIAYAAYSIRSRLDWAIDCDHSYNTPYCVPFNEINVTHSDDARYPDNFWPAQQFNRYLIRGNEHPMDNLTQRWEPNEWYLGPSKEHFYLSLPSFILLLSHCLMWTLIIFIMTKFQDHLGWILTNFCLSVPIAIYFFIITVLTFTTFHFGTGIQNSIPSETVEVDPIDLWADIQGLLRTSLVSLDYSLKGLLRTSLISLDYSLKGLLRTSLISLDYSSTFTGLVLLGTSKRNQGSSQINILYLLIFLLVPPFLLSFLRWGCEGHLSIIQSAYRYYATTDETFTFDVLPVCLATSPGGSFLSILFYLAHFFYSSFAPILVYLLLIEQSIIDQFPSIPRHLIIPSIIAAFSIPSLILYMPMGTKIATAFRYLSQSSIVHLLVYFTIYFIYGWERLESDIQSQLDHSSTFMSWLYSVNGPICTILLFTFIPMILCSHFTSVFDLLMTGSDVLKHIDLGIGQLILAPKILSRFVGTLFMLAPTIIIVATASIAYYRNYSSRLSASTLFEPTSSFLSHSTLSGQSPIRPHSLAYGFFNQLLPNVQLKFALKLVFIFELAMWIVVCVLFGWNLFVMYIGKGSDNANMYRSFMLLVFVSLHAISLFEMRLARIRWDSSERLILYIGTATMEMGMLNGYMWMFSSDHSWGIDILPLLFAMATTIIRGVAIFTVIAVRAHIADISRPTRTRDATEVYDQEMRMGEEEDDSPIIFELAR